MNQNQIDSTISKIPTKASSSAPFSQSSSISAQSYATISWKEASEKNPCPLCQKPDWCSIAENGSAVLCRRTDRAPMGWKFIKSASDGYPVYARENADRDRTNPPPQKPRTLKPQPVPLPPGAITLARLGKPPTHPQKRKWENPTPIEERIVRETAKKKKLPLEDFLRNCKTIIEYPYSSTQWTKRIEYSDPEKAKGYSKATRPCYLNGDTEKIGKGDRSWDAYRLSEILEHGADQWVLGVEGEPCVEAARYLGLAAFTFQGGSWTGGDIERFVLTCKEAGIKGIAYLPDNDDAGLKKSAQLYKICAQAQFPFLSLNPSALWSECPDNGDIADWIKWGMEQGWDKEEFIKRLEENFKYSAISREQAEDERRWNETPSTPNSLSYKEAFTECTLLALFGDIPWICVNDKLYYWTGTHYKHSEDGFEIKRLTNWCGAYVERDKKGRLVKPYANPRKVKEALEWVKMKLWVSPDQVNPPGLNCTNGVLTFNWKGSTPTWNLIPHSPDLYYIYEPLVKFDPGANPESCDRLLNALDAPQRDIFLKTVAASLNLPTVRKFKGRLVRALILLGQGSNGKDTLREATRLLFGKQGLTGCTLSDFAAYDKGRKFPLARLIHSRINWASENANANQLDQIQSLKAFITGDPLSFERKGKDESEFKPAAIALFNANDTPKMRGVLEAIASRYGVLKFNKTFKIGANPKNKNELEADPRFKDDPEFLKQEVLPAFLNRVLDALSRLMSEGIDYSCTKKALEDIQAQNSHLFQFAQDTGLNYAPNSTLTAGEIWAALEEWYLANGTLAYEESSTLKQKTIWTEQANPYDRNVKGANQVLGRFQQLFPQAKRVTIPHPNGGKKNVQALKGIGFSPGDGGGDGGQPTPIPPQPTPIPPQDPPQQTTENQGFHPTHPSFSDLTEKNEKTENPPIDSGNVDLKNDLKNSDTPQQLGWVGCDAQKSRVPGVDNWGGTGVENDPTGVGETIKDATSTAANNQNAIASAPSPLEKLPELYGWDEYHSYRPYPNPKSNSINTSQQRALKIREAVRAAGTKQDLSALRRDKGGDFSVDELLWVQNWLKNFFPAEYNHLMRTTKITQPSLLD